LIAYNIRVCVILHIYLLYNTYKSNGFFGFKKNIVSFKGVVHYTFNIRIMDCLIRGLMDKTKNRISFFLEFALGNSLFYLFSFAVCFANEIGIARGQHAKAMLRFLTHTFSGF